LFEEIAHHEKRQDQAGDEQRNAKNEADTRAIPERETDYQTGNEQD